MNTVQSWVNVNSLVHHHHLHHPAPLPPPPLPPPPPLRRSRSVHHLPVYVGVAKQQESSKQSVTVTSQTENPKIPSNIFSKTIVGLYTCTSMHIYLLSLPASLSPSLPSLSYALTRKNCSGLGQISSLMISAIGSEVLSVSENHIKNEGVSSRPRFLPFISAASFDVRSYIIENI